MYSNITDHSRTLMFSEGTKIEQIGTIKSELGALLIEGIHASRSQKSVDRAFEVQGHKPQNHIKQKQTPKYFTYFTTNTCSR